MRTRANYQMGGNNKKNYSRSTLEMLFFLFLKATANIPINNIAIYLDSARLLSPEEKKSMFHNISSSTHSQHSHLYIYTLLPTHSIPHCTYLLFRKQFKTSFVSSENPWEA